MENEMSKHTPGPWTAVKNSAYWEIDGPDDFGGVADTCASSAGEPDFGRSMALGEANARLIAAAPDLLAACKAALELAEGDDPGAGCDTREEAEAARCRWRESIEQSIRAAIAKAEGGAA